MIAIDTNVLIYSVDVADPVKHAKARAVIHTLFVSGATTVIPWQVAVEFLAKPRKWQASGQLSGEEVAIRFDEFLAAWDFAIPTFEDLSYCHAIAQPVLPFSLGKFACRSLCRSGSEATVQRGHAGRRGLRRSRNRQPVRSVKTLCLR